MVKIKTMGNEAIAQNGAWQSKDKLTQAMLRSLIPWHGVSPSDPNPNLTAAQKAIETFGGEILHADPVEYVEGRIY